MSSFESEKADSPPCPNSSPKSDSSSTSSDCAACSPLVHTRFADAILQVGRKAPVFELPVTDLAAYRNADSEEKKVDGSTSDASSWQSFDKTEIAQSKLESASENSLEDDSQERSLQKVVNLGDYLGRWLLLIFYPRDFSFVCPTELTRFSARIEDFQAAGADLLAVSVDDIETHYKFLETPTADGGVGRLRFPLASDTEGLVAEAYGVWDRSRGLPLRGLFIIDPEGVLQYSVVHSMSVGRSVDETLRVLHAIQSGGLCPVDWTDADGNIDLHSAIKPGRVLGHYRIEEEIGGGSFGTVLSAWDLRLHRPVALKVLRHNLQKSRNYSLAEARSVATLNHPNICSIYSVDQDDGLSMIVMPLIDGNALCNVIQMNPLTKWPKRICKIFQGIVSGVQTAHKHHVVHGDLKPANFMIDADDHVTILDFGLSKFTNRMDTDLLDKKFFHRRKSDSSDEVSEPVDSQQGETPNSLPEPAKSIADGDTVDFPVGGLDSSEINLDDTKSASTQPSISQVGTNRPIRKLSGTPAYMAPEQTRGLPASKESDIFSLGLILFELSTGRRAMVGNRITDVFVLLGDEDFLEGLAEKVQPPFRSVVKQMLAVDPDKRPTAEEILESVSLWEPFVDATEL